MSLSRGASILLIFIIVMLNACAIPNIQGLTPSARDPSLNSNYFIAHDGVYLPIRKWKSKAQTPQAIIIAVHGFNDYSNFFSSVGNFLSKKNITTYAFDQRGFGATPKRGLWPGVTSLTEDLINLILLVRKRYPKTPLYLFGESMGGGIVMVTVKNAREKALNLRLNGIILSAPAVWGRQFMPWYQSSALWIAAHSFPATKLTGKGLNITASDNKEMLRALGNDPLIIKETRVDAIYGLTNLMDEALEAAREINEPLLVLYGKKDEVIPKTPIIEMLSRLPENTLLNRETILYDDGYHMLTRDLQAKKVWADIFNWIELRNRQLRKSRHESE